MATLAKHTISIQDLEGNLVSPVTVEVRRQSPGLPLQSLFSDRDGTVPLANPIVDAVQDENGLGFYVAGGSYQIEVTATGLGVSTRQNVAIGTAAEHDTEEFMLAANNLGEVADPEEAFDNIKQSASETNEGVVEEATIAEVRAATPQKFIDAGKLEEASALVTLTDAATISVDWDAFINGQVTLTDNRALGNPTNGQPGTWRTILVLGNDGTNRTLTFGNQYFGDLPTLTDIDDAKQYLLMIYCLTSTVFMLKATQFKP